MFINPERAQQVAFADPDYCVTTGFAVPEGNPDGLSDFQSVIDSGVTIGVLRGGDAGGYDEVAVVRAGQIQNFVPTPDLFQVLPPDCKHAFAVIAVTATHKDSSKRAG